MKSKILFVDDETRILDGLKRSLHGMRNEWDLYFAAGGKQALIVMQENPIDIIVTDMRMPEMNGLELLKIVKAKYPRVIRFVLSGHADLEVIKQAVGLTHQYISKPCDVELLRKSLVRVLLIRDRIQNPTVQKVVTQLRSIPSLPSIYKQIQELIQKEEVNMNKIAELINKDIGMRTKVLQIVNSSFFGLSRQVNEVLLALNLIGLDIIKDLILTIHIFDQLPSTLMQRFHLEQIWKHSFEAAEIAKKICKAEGYKQKAVDLCFSATMMHDLGRIVLITEFPTIYSDLLKEFESKGTALRLSESAAFSVTHADVGSYLLSTWGFDDEIVEMVAFHHNPCVVNPKELTLTGIVHIADIIANLRTDNRYGGKTVSYDTEYLSGARLESKIKRWESI